MFVDAWYALYNANQTDTPLTGQCTTRRGDFPSNLESLKILHLLRAFVQANGASCKVEVALQFTSEGSQPSAGGLVWSIDGVISTRPRSATAWLPVLGPLPVGTWIVALPQTHEVRSEFKDEQIGDVLCVIT
jgi:hypothetical protein